MKYCASTKEVQPFFLLVNTSTVTMARVSDDAPVSDQGCHISISLEGPDLMTVHPPGSVFCRCNDLGMDFCWGWSWQFFRDFGGAQKYTLTG